MYFYLKKKLQYLFMKREPVLILITKLAEEKRYSELIDVYECYLNNITEKNERPLLHEHINIVTNALFIQVKRWKPIINVNLMPKFQNKIGHARSSVKTKVVSPKVRSFQVRNVTAIDSVFISIIYSTGRWTLF